MNKLKKKLDALNKLINKEERIVMPDELEINITITVTFDAKGVEVKGLEQLDNLLFNEIEDSATEIYGFTPEEIEEAVRE